MDDDGLRRRSWAARPALLEAAADPDLLMALVLADLMSPSLWEFRDGVERLLPGAVQTFAHDPSQDEQTRLVMEEIHTFMDRHLFHISPLETEAVWGRLDLAEERARIGAAEVDYTVGLIRDALEERRGLGILTDAQDIVPLIDAGAFPDYEYSTIDAIRAHRRRLGHGKHKPLGVTCCADEAVLAAALAWAAGHVRLENAVVIGSPTHYTTLVERHGRGYWFNGKHECHDAVSWAQACAATSAGDVQAAFEARVQGFDRILTLLGSHRFHGNESTLGEERLDRRDDWLKDFFGAELRQITDARRRGVRFAPEPLDETDLQGLDAAPDAAAARRRVEEIARDHPDSVAALARYAFRDLGVERPQAYLDAAARGHLVRRQAAASTRLDDALGVVAAVAGRESVFSDLERISLPDEVLLFGSGSHRDKALLLYTLVRHAPFLSPAERDGVDLVFAEAGSLVVVGGRAIDAETLRAIDVPAAEGAGAALRLPERPAS
jgi:hypothetical protein